MNNLRVKLRKELQPLFRTLKWKRYCRMGLNQLDEKLEPYLNFDNGVFIEAGANDGMKQSNTYYLEAVRSVVYWLNPCHIFTGNVLKIESRQKFSMLHW